MTRRISRAKQQIKDSAVPAVSAHLLEMAGERAAAREAYLAAAGRTSNRPPQRYLHARAARLQDQDQDQIH